MDQKVFYVQKLFERHLMKNGLLPFGMQNAFSRLFSNGFEKQRHLLTAKRTCLPTNVWLFCKEIGIHLPILA